MGFDIGNLDLHLYLLVSIPSLRHSTWRSSASTGECIYIRCSALHSESPLTCRGEPKAPGRGMAASLSEQGGLPPPLTPPLPSPMSDSKKMAGLKPTGTGPMKRTANHGQTGFGVQARLCTRKKHSENRKAGVFNPSPNPKIVRPEIETNPNHAERGL